MNEATIHNNQEIIRKAYAAFNARDIDAIIPMMHPDVQWTKAWEGDYANGHDEVRAYWQRQWQEINPRVTPVGFRERSNGTLEVQVDQLVKDMDSNVLFDGRVVHVYVISDGLMVKMDVEQVAAI